MRQTLLFLIALLMSVMNQTARADFSRVDLKYFGEAATPDGPKSVYRVYAYFTEGADRVVSWSSAFSTNPVAYTTLCAGGLGEPADPFYDTGFGSTAPSQPIIDVLPLAQWDTFFTIGVSIREQGSGPPDSPDQTSLSPGFPPIASGNQVLLQGHAVSVAAGAAQARADYANDGDPQLRVLLMQLTVTSGGPAPRGMIVVNVTSPGAGGGSFVGNFDLLQPFGVCCLPNGTCQHMWSVQCWTVGGIAMDCGDLCDVCPVCADADGDRDVDVDDLQAVILAWGECKDCDECPADVNVFQGSVGDCHVNADDLAVVILGWGPCP